MKQELIDKKSSRSGLVTGATLFIIVAGLIHIAIVPLHWAHAPAHGTFLALVGIAEVAWGIAFWRQPSAALYRIGMVMAGWLITLWVITRLLPAPFGHGPEAVEISGIICRLFEGLGIAALAALVVSGEAYSEIKTSAWRSIGLLLTLSLILGGLTYGAALAAESVSPWTKGDNSADLSYPMKNKNTVERSKEVKEAVIINNSQEVDVKINASGYSPNVIIAKRGIPLKINIHSEEDAGCASEIIFDDFNTKKTVPAGSTDLIEILPAQEGTFKFRCPMDMVKGELIIK